MRKRDQTATKKDHAYRNPVILAQEWRNLLLHGGYRSFSELATYLRVSRARVTTETIIYISLAGSQVIDNTADIKNLYHDGLAEAAAAAAKGLRLLSASYGRSE